MKKYYVKNNWLGFFLMSGLVFQIGCSVLNNSPKIATGVNHLDKFEAVITKKSTLNYLIYLPDNFNESKEKFPIVMFLHGSGERGEDVNKVKVNGPPMLVEKGKKFPFILVSPQCPDNKWWDADELKQLLDYVVKTYRADENRIYVTGLSMGGFGTWDLLTKYPNYFAAAVPVCGGGEPRTTRLIGKTPVWAFHGAKDDVVPYQRSEEMVNTLNSFGGNAKFTLYPDANHNSWDLTYNNQEVYDWMLSQKLK